MLERLPRIHAFEWEDLPWFPSLIRRYMQDHLYFLGNVSDLPYRAFSARLMERMQQAGEHRILDLCSGSGGPIQVIVKLLDRQGYPVRAKVTDLFPNPKAYELIEQANLRVQGVKEPVNAIDPPEHLEGFRLMCNSFHHFRPEDARRILASAVRYRRGIAIVEMVGRNIPALLSVFVGAILLFVATPFIRPFRWSRLLFTYVIPLVPLFLIWDGIVSCFRVYSPHEMRKLVEGIPGADYEWEIGKLSADGLPAKATYLIGLPKS